MESKHENKIIFGIALIIASLGSFMLLGASGLKTMLGAIVIMFLPFYLIFDYFSLSDEEKIIFSFFASITIFPSLTYWLGFIVPFRIAVLAVFLAMMLAAYLPKLLKKKAVSSS